MADKRVKHKGRKTTRSFFMFTHNMARHQNYIGLSKDGKLILLYFKSQFNGKNNGDLVATIKMVKANGYGSSASQLNKALKELEAKGFIVKTRQGGKNQCNLFAITSEPIHDCKGKHDFPVTTIASNAWRKIESCSPYMDKTSRD